MFSGIRPIFRVAKRRLSIICWLRYDVDCKTRRDTIP